MAEYLIQDSTLSAIADAIREKTGKADTITPEQMPTEIAGISGSDITLIDNVEVAPNFANGDYLLVAQEGYAVKGATILKPATLIPENIANGVEIAGVVGTLETGSSADVRYVTFMNGSTVLYKKPVAVGDDCVDVLTKGLIETPTKESTVQYDYTYYGWGASDNGAADANILKNITEDKTVYAIYTSTLRRYTITYLDDDGATVLHTEQLAYGTVPSYAPSKSGSVFVEWSPSPTAVIGNASYVAVWSVSFNTIPLITLNTTGEPPSAYTAVGWVTEALIEGAKYSVTINGETFEETAKKYYLSFGSSGAYTYVALGNPYVRTSLRGSALNEVRLGSNTGAFVSDNGGWYHISVNGTTKFSGTLFSKTAGEYSLSVTRMPD